MSPDSLVGFFAQPSSPLHRRYEVLRAFFLEGQTAETVARRFGYSVGSVYAMTRDFRRLKDPAAFFFRPPKVDFDLAITILAYNLLRLLACDLPPGYRRLTARSLYDRLLCNAAHIHLAPHLCTVALKKKRDLPALLEAFQAVGNQRIPWLGNRPIVFQGATTS